MTSGPATWRRAPPTARSSQLRNYGVGLMLGLAAVGYVQAANTLMGPFMVIFFGMGLVTVPEAARILRRSPRHLPLFCAARRAAGSLCWRWRGGSCCWWRCREGSGTDCSARIWRPTYPLVLPLTISIMGGCVSAGAGTGLHALGAARRSLRAMVLASVVFRRLRPGGALPAERSGRCAAPRSPHGSARCCSGGSCAQRCGSLTKFLPGNGCGPCASLVGIQLFTVRKALWRDLFQLA